MTTTWTWNHALTGVVPPLISPLGDGGDADAGAMAALVEHVVGGGCTGLFVLGGCGEGAWLTTAQRDGIVRAAVKAAAGRVPVLAAVMLPATGPAMEAARRARGEGADAVVVGSPYYFAVDGGGHRRHVEAVLEAAELPGLLYNIPQCTHAILAADTVAALARDSRVLGMKDSAGDFLTFQRYLAVKGERPDFRVLQGQESLLASSVLHGGDGAVPGVANIAPRLCVDLVRAAHARDSVRAIQLQEQVTGLTRVYEHGHWLPALKHACAKLGLGNGRPAPPLVSAAPAARAAIDEILAHLTSA